MERMRHLCHLWDKELEEPDETYPTIACPVSGKITHIGSANVFRRQQCDVADRLVQREHHGHSVLDECNSVRLRHS